MRVAWIIAVSFIACGGAAPAPQAPKAAAPEPDAPATPASEAKSDAPAPASSAEGKSGKADLPDAPPPAETKSNNAAEIDLDDWASQHEIKVELVSDGCESADLGDHPADVIWCKHHTESKKGVVTYTRALYVARAKRFQKLVELPLAAGPLELKDAHSDAERYHVRLALERVDDKHVVLKEAPGLDCARAEKENHDLATTSPDVVADYVAATKKVCAARGNYEWAGGTLRKTR